MPREPRNPWYRALLRELRAGRMTPAEAARIAGVSRERIAQWCAAAGFDAAKARANLIAVFYARQLLRMSKRDRVAIAPGIAGKGRKPSRPRKVEDKAAVRAETDSKVVDFLQAGGRIKQLPPRHRR